MLLTGKKVLVLEGKDGIGAAITTRFRAEGAEVVSVEILSDADEVKLAFDRAVAEMGAVDTLVNAFSNWSVCDPADWTAAKWQELSESNVAVAVSVAQLSLERLQKPGAVCFISSTWAMATSPEMGLTGASKAAVGPLTKALALAGSTNGLGLRANTIVMGLIDSPDLRELVDQRGRISGNTNTNTPTLFEETALRVPMQRAGTVEEVAKAAVFLCSDRARMINGASVLVDGGLLYA
jgi:NAD(P)-dependent dehydrogenase (short-subunit alcohol dehydrogenase family)